MQQWLAIYSELRPETDIGLLLPTHYGSLQVKPQLVSHAPEYCQAFFFRTWRRRRVFEIVMQLLCAAEEHRASLAGIVADGNHVIEWLSLKFIHILRAMPGNINPQLAHDGYRLRAHEARFHSSADNLETLPRIMPQQPFGHLASR